MRVLKWIGLLLAVLVSILLVAVVVLRFFIDPNDFKAQISALVEDASGYQLSLDGELSWSFYPVLGFQSEAVSVVAAPDQSAFLNLRKLAVGVELMPLFSRQLKVQQLLLEGLDAQLLVNEQGHPNWQLPTTSDTSAKPASSDPQSESKPESSSAGSMPELSIPLIRIVDSNMRYRDAVSGTDIGVVIDRLELENVQLAEPIVVRLKGSLMQVDGPRIQLVLDTQLLPDLQKQVYRISPFQLQADIEGLLDAPLAVVMDSAIELDMAKDVALIDLTRLQLADSVLSGEVSAAALSTAPAFRGTLKSQPLQLPQLLQQFAVQLPATSSKSALKQASVALSFNGNAQHLAVSDLVLKLDQSTLTGSLAVTDFASQALEFDVLLDRIILDDYLPPATEPQQAQPTSTTQTNQEPEQLLPLDLLRRLDLGGRLRATSVTVQQEEIRDIELRIRAKHGVVDVSTIQAQLLAGRLDGKVTIDAKTDLPKLVTSLKVQDVELTSVSSRFMQDALLSGKASFDVNSTATGNSVDGLLQSALGQMNLQLNEGVLHGVNLNSIVVDALREQLGNFEAVVPQYQKYLPRELRKDTDISKLLANAKLENGHLIMPRFEFFTGESGIDASGKVDLVNQGFDYDFGVVLSALERNKYLKGTRWPVHCAGALSGSPADWCRPDTKKMGAILRGAASNALKDKSAAEIGDKVGLDAQDQEQLELELKEKAKEEEDRVKRKLQKKLDKLLNKN
ncbi:MAG: AsmA family protein [Ketobacter sp.]|nr:AsmA family protein [Ketobacter sp.]